MFFHFFKGAKCRLSECKGNSFTLPSARQLDVVTAGYVTAKKGKTGNKAAGKRAQRKFTCFAERERVRENKGHKRQALLTYKVNIFLKEN